MRIRLNKPIIGYADGEKDHCRVHADEGDILKVVFCNPTYFLCDSNKYPDQIIPVFNSQCDIVEIPIKHEIEDPHLFEKYYHVYEEEIDTELDDPFNTAFESED